MKKRGIQAVLFIVVVVLFICGLTGMSSFLRVKEKINSTPKQTKNTYLQKKRKEVKSAKALQPNTATGIKATVQNASIDTYLQQQGFQGTALIVRRGKVVLSQAYGEADQVTSRRNSVNTTYYLGSAQKSIIATAILQLQGQGKLKIDDPIAKYIADFPNGQQIKLRNLLNHTSGIKGREETGDYIAPKEVVEQIKQQGIKAQPGSWNYQDSNYSTLAYVVELIEKSSIQDYVKKRIFEPAKMLNSGFYQTFEKTIEPSKSYKIKEEKFHEAKLPNLSQLYGAGDIYTTATDLYLYDKALMTGVLLKEKEKKEMFTSGSRSTYGMGFYVNPGSYSSHGVLGGWNCINSFTHTGLTYIVLLENTNKVKSLGQVANHIYELLNKSEEPN
ncbi:serine hydrolase domain-containing protein [Vagococcus entomophilus]|uniref:Penicillin-binding protein n=1 Tax=Vagococcus entomophilus TaxID=1160095 RepID=A0A430AFB7_9ENTE|nr:serine hydrolase domain-containing protein [Vagococcus entomophilus]RSU06440.1 penicillin-binding protein [Vagococcus entomophilus]